jgi:hypothetical protein
MSTFRSEAERIRAIAELPYRFWEERGSPEGSPNEDRCKAELNIDREQDSEGGKEKTFGRSNTKNAIRNRKGNTDAGYLKEPRP